MSPRVAGVVLAAGEGSRMGKTKQLLPFRGKTFLECVVDAALASTLNRIVVVLGHQAPRLEALLENRRVTIVLNPAYATGQGASIKTGLRAVKDDADAVLFLLGDQPLITPGIIDQILAAYRTSPAPIVLPVFAGKRGNPALFDRETFPRLEALSPDAGARILFDDYPGRILRVPVDDPSIHLDIDTEDDYRQLLRDNPG